MPISRMNMARLLGRLTAAMGKPFSDAKVDRQAEEYARAMGNIPEYAVEWAVDVAIRDMDTYPKAAQMRNLAKKCPTLPTGDHDQGLGAQMRRWETDPWGTVGTLEDDRKECKSTPCPACGSVIVFSDRGAVIVHDLQRHKETGIGFSNIGKPEWFEMGPVPEPVRRPLSAIRKAAPMALAEIIPPKPPQPEPSGVTPPPPPPDWEAEQQARAEAMA